MFEILQILTLLLVVLAMSPALAHALELPGKMRLSREAYTTMQPVYYPGFTVAGGIGEVGGMVFTTILVFATPYGTADFWLTLTALLGLVGMHAAYWVLTHPVNKFWLEDEKLSGFGSGFFSFASERESGDQNDWSSLRNRWEYSHVVRAILSAMSVVALAIALV